MINHLNKNKMETTSKKKPEVKCNNCKWEGIADDLKIELNKVGKDTHIYINCPQCNNWEGIEDYE